MARVKAPRAAQHPRGSDPGIGGGDGRRRCPAAVGSAVTVRIPCNDNAAGYVRTTAVSSVCQPHMWSHLRDSAPEDDPLLFGQMWEHCRRAKVPRTRENQADQVPQPSTWGALPSASITDPMNHPGVGVRSVLSASTVAEHRGVDRQRSPQGVRWT